MVRFRFRQAVLCAALCMTLAGGNAGARSPERAVIRLSCGAAPEALCQALIQALAEAAQGQPAIRRVAPGEERPARDGDLGLALVLDAATPDRLSGHLDWQGRDGMRRAGPDLRLDVADATVTPQSYASVTRELLRLTPALMAALGGQP